MIGNRCATLALTVAFGVAGCSSAQSVPVASQAPVTVAATASIVPAGGTIDFPNAGGYGGTFAYSANDAAAPVGVAITSRNGSIAGLPGPAPSGTVLATYTFAQTSAVKYRAWYRLLTTIDVPAGVRAAGHTFSEYGYDLTAGVAEGSNPGTLSGTTVSFGPGLGPVTLQAHEYCMTLVMQ